MLSWLDDMDKIGYVRSMRIGKVIAPEDALHVASVYHSLSGANARAPIVFLCLTRTESPQRGVQSFCMT